MSSEQKTSSDADNDLRNTHLESLPHALLPRNMAPGAVTVKLNP